MKFGKCAPNQCQFEGDLREKQNASASNSARTLAPTPVPFCHIIGKTCDFYFSLSSGAICMVICSVGISITRSEFIS